MKPFKIYFTTELLKGDNEDIKKVIQSLLDSKSLRDKGDDGANIRESKDEPLDRPNIIKVQNAIKSLHLDGIIWQTISIEELKVSTKVIRPVYEDEKEKTSLTSYSIKAKLESKKYPCVAIIDFDKFVVVDTENKNEILGIKMLTNMKAFSTDVLS